MRPVPFRPVLIGVLALLFGCKAKLASEAPFVDPVLTMETDGYYHGNTIEIEGQATGITGLTVDGLPVTPTGDSYKADVNLVRGVNLLEVKGEDGNGDQHRVRKGVISGDYSDPDETVEDAVTLRLNRGGLDKIGGLVSGLVVAEDIKTSMMALNPLYEADYPLGNNLSAALSDLQFDPMQIDTDPRPGVMELEVVIPNLLVTVNATGEVVYIDFDQDLTLTATRAIIRGDILADVNNQGELSMELMNSTVELEGFAYDLSLLPDFIEGALLVDTLRGFIEDTLKSQIEERVPALLGSQLDGLDFSFETELLGKNVAVAATLVDLYADQDGLQLQTHLDVVADAVDEKTYRGYLFADSTNLPHPSRTEDLGLAVSDNMLNNILLQVWRSGLLDLDLDSAEGEIEPALLAQLGATGAARVIVTSPVPPVFVEREGRAQAQITELGVRIETPNGTNGEYVDLAVTAFIDLELTAEAGVIKLELGTPDVVIDVRDSDWGISDNTLADLLADQLPIDTLISLLGAFEFPIPTVAGLTLSSADAERDSSGVHTTIGATL